MKNSFLLGLCLGIFFYNCSSDIIAEDTIVEQPSKNKVEILLNGEPPQNRISGLTAFLCCENHISVSFDHLVDLENGLYFGGNGLAISLDRQGNLQNLNYTNYAPRNEYYSPFFYPTATLSVTNFMFAENQILKFKISGKIFERTYNFFAEPEFLNLEASFEIKEFSKCICNTVADKITSNNDFNFRNLSRGQQGNNIRYVAHTNNGYQLEFLNFNQTFSAMPLGVYAFDDNAVTHRIDFRKFTGVPRAFSPSIIPQEWLKYETSGSFEIVERYQVNGANITKVKFNFVAKENGTIIHEFSEGMIETQW